MNDLTKLVTFLKNWWGAIKKHTYSVSVDNFPEYPEFPEIPETIIPEYPTEIKVSNLEEIKPIDKFADIVKAIEKQSKDLKTDDQNIVGELKAILEEVRKEEEDLTPEVIKKISELIKSVDSKSIDFSVLEKGITEIKDLLDSVKEYDEIKVKLNGKQFNKLAEKTAKAIASGGGGGIDEVSKQNLTNISNKVATETTQSEISAKLDPATDIETQDLITVGPTAVEITFTNDAGQVILCAGDGNIGNIFIGKSDVANNGNKAFAVLAPGQTRAFPYDKSVNALYAVSSTFNQKLSASLKLGNGSITFDGFDFRVSPNLLTINSNTSGILGKFVSPTYVNKQDIILNGGTDFPFENNVFGPHKVRKSSNARTDIINNGGDWFGCSGRDLSTSGGIVTVDISRQNLDHQYRALESVKFKITNNVAVPEAGVVEVRLMGYDARVGAYVPKAFTCLEINTTKLTDKDTYVCGMTPTVITWNRDDFRFGFLVFRDVGGTLSSSETFIEVLLEDYSFNNNKS